MTVNAVGSFALGLIAAIGMQRMGLGPFARAGIMMGVLGGFTTFSTFTLETFQLGEAGIGLARLSTSWYRSAPA